MLSFCKKNKVKIIFLLIFLVVITICIYRGCLIKRLNELYASNMVYDENAECVQNDLGAEKKKYIDSLLEENRIKIQNLIEVANKQWGIL